MISFTEAIRSVTRQSGVHQNCSKCLEFMCRFYRDISNFRTGEIPEFRFLMRISGVVRILTGLHAEGSPVCSR